MKKSKFPKGWDEAKTERVAHYYDTQSPAAAAVEDDETFNTRSRTVMRIPLALVPAVRKLIAKKAI